MHNWLRKAGIAVGVAGGMVTLNYAPVWGSIFGEENVTLAEIVVQLLNIKSEMQDLNEAAAATAQFTHDTLETYRLATAGIEEIRNYTTDRFLRDFKQDVYTLYPGFADLEHATGELARWEDSRSASPWTAYEAITAFADDLSAPLRKDLKEGKTDMDRELLYAGEAAGAMALAFRAEESTRAFDEDLVELARLVEDPMLSPGQAEQASARAMVILAAQQSHVIRLLSRSVRLEGVDMAMNYVTGVDGKNETYSAQKDTSGFVEEALRPPRMLRFGP